ncbi:LPS assembly protein LptD [bacterium]|nr:LPS assembly protein LptD [candidate division CSSED10-310 bacterium]
MSHRTILIISLLIFIPLLFTQAQGLLDSSSDSSDLFSRFAEDRWQDKTDQEIMKESFQDKRRRYESLLTRQSPVFFQADVQEIIEKDRLFILTGNVEIWKDDFRILADKVIIDQVAGDITANGNVELYFGKDILTGDNAFYNFDLGTGWLSNFRGAIEPSLFIEGTLLEKLVDYEKTGEGQYVIHDGFVTACAGDSPDWRITTKYGLIRIQNYAHMNRSTFWVSKVPIFYTPYWFYPTKTDRATGLLLPFLSYNNRRGIIFSEEFFLVINRYMDVTLGGTLYSEIGIMEELEWRNAFDQYSRGRLTVDHLKERKSPSTARSPQERWSSRYEQTYIFPFDLRGTIDLDFRSDEDFDKDYGYGLDHIVDRYMTSRVSLTKNWSLAHLTIDGTYEKDFNQYRDETIQHIPRIEYGTGSQSLIGELKGMLLLKSEYLKREGKVVSSFNVPGGDIRIEDWLKRDAFRSDAYGEIWYPFKEIAWFSFTPYVSLRETYWSKRKTFDPDHIYGTWATYPEGTPVEDNKLFAGVWDTGEGIRREFYSYGFEWTGPKFYRIYPMVGYDRVLKLKHIIEPRIDFKITPEVFQDRILEFDSTDRLTPGQVLTYSISNRLLAKIQPKGSEKGKKAGEGDDQHEAGKPPEDNGAQSSTGTVNDNAEYQTSKETSEGTEEDRREETGLIREFGVVTLSQTYDFWKAERWDQRDPPLPGVDERVDYPLGNIRLEATINPFYNIYFSARAEFDPFHHDLANNYIYGHIRQDTWRMGMRWDFTRNFINPAYDLHSLALEGSIIASDKWSFASWVKYDFTQEYFPRANLDITYTAQCWSLTLHSFYSNNRTGMGTPASPFEDDHEIQFGISITFKNLDSVGPRKFGKFWWGESNGE